MTGEVPPPSLPTRLHSINARVRMHKVREHFLRRGGASYIRERVGHCPV